MPGQPATQASVRMSPLALGLAQAWDWARVVAGEPLHLLHHQAQARGEARHHPEEVPELA